MTSGEPPRSLDLASWLSEVPVSVRVTGDSMEPSLREGDSVEVVAAGRADLMTGDIVVFRAGGELIVHRLLRCGAETFLEMGDNRTLAAEYPWPEHLGRGVALVRDGVRTDLLSGESRRLARARAAKSMRLHRVERLASRLPGTLLPRLLRGLARRLL